MITWEHDWGWNRRGGPGAGTPGRSGWLLGSGPRDLRRPDPGNTPYRTDPQGSASGTGTTQSTAVLEFCPPPRNPRRSPGAGFSIARRCPACFAPATELTEGSKATLTLAGAIAANRVSRRNSQVIITLTVTIRPVRSHLAWHWLCLVKTVHRSLVSSTTAGLPCTSAGSPPLRSGRYCRARSSPHRIRCRLQAAESQHPIPGTVRCRAGPAAARRLSCRKRGSSPVLPRGAR